MKNNTRSPLFVVGIGFVQAKDLKLSDKLLLSDGKPVIIEEIKVEQLEVPETTYNFEVEDFHTYYVSESNVLVHNRCVTAIKNDQSITRDIIGEGKYGTYDIAYNDGSHYIGKGAQARMWQSASNHEIGNLKVTSVKWRPASNNIEAFIQEARWMNKLGWVDKNHRGVLLNLINSPGHKLL